MTVHADPRDAYGPRRLLLAVVALYFAVFGSLLYAGDSLPYVFDNNESFSSYFHAINLHEYGLEKSYGATDESYGRTPESHPYVYTHGGNFPRLPALLLYRLGARTVESQIVWSTFTVGLGTLLLAFAFFRRLAGARFAALLCALLISDYLMFAQWNVVTWRVWGGLLFFASLVCASGCAGPRRRICLALHLPIFAALFYTEVTFAAFTGILSALWVARELRWQPLRVLVSWASQLAGALVAVAVLFWQNVKYLGRDGFMTDLYLTFVARNASASGDVLYRQVRDFADEHKLVFWYNFVDGSALRSPWVFVRRFVSSELQVYTPALLLLVLVVILALAASAAADALERRRDGVRKRGRFAALRTRVERLSREPLAGRAATTALLVFFFVAFVAVLGLEQRFVGALRLEFPGSAGFQQLEDMLLAVGSLGLALWLGATLWRERAPVCGTRTLAALSVPLLSLVFVLLQRKLYHSGQRPLWAAVALPFQSMVSFKLLSLAVAAQAIVAVYAGRERESLAALRAHLRPAGAFFGLAFLSFLLVYMLSPGYLFSGYLIRQAPFTVFFHLVPIAIALHAVSSQARDAWQRRSSGDLAVLPLLALVAAALFIPSYWAVTQLRYAQIFPPDHFSFLARLGEPPYRGASFVVNTYAAPIAAVSGSWAYFDPAFAKGEIVLGEQGYEVSRELHYLWLADRDENPEYRTPQYFICVMAQDMRTGVARVARRRPFEADGCSDLGIVKAALDPAPKPLSHELVETDQSGRDRFAIVKLDWDYPPYLQGLDGSDERVRLCAERKPGALRVRVRYAYAQQQGKDEGSSRVFVYRAGEGVGEDEGEDELLAEAPGQRELRLPADFAGALRAGVIPASASKRGPESRSGKLVVGPTGESFGSCGDGEHAP